MYNTRFGFALGFGFDAFVGLDLLDLVTAGFFATTFFTFFLADDLPLLVGRGAITGVALAAKERTLADYVQTHKFKAYYNQLGMFIVCIDSTSSPFPDCFKAIGDSC